MHDFTAPDALHAALSDVFAVLPDNGMIKWYIDLSKQTVSFMDKSKQYSAHEKMHLCGVMEDVQLDAKFHAWMNVAPHFHSIPTCAKRKTNRSFFFVKELGSKRTMARARFLFNMPDIDTAPNTNDMIGLQCATPTHDELKLALRVFSLPVGPLVHWRSRLGNNTIDFCADEDPRTARLIEKLYRSTRAFLTHPMQQTSPDKTPMLERITTQVAHDIPTPDFLLA